MLQFEKKLIITGAEQKVRKDGTLYTLIHVLGENGATFACVYKGDVNKVMSVKKMEQHNLKFELSVGCVTITLEVIGISLPL